MEGIFVNVEIEDLLTIFHSLVEISYWKEQFERYRREYRINFPNEVEDKIYNFLRKLENLPLEKIYDPIGGIKIKFQDLIDGVEYAVNLADEIIMDFMRIYEDSEDEILKGLLHLEYPSEELAKAYPEYVNIIALSYIRWMKTFMETLDYNIQRVVKQCGEDLSWRLIRNIIEKAHRFMRRWRHRLYGDGLNWTVSAIKAIRESMTAIELTTSPERLCEYIEKLYTVFYMLSSKIVGSAYADLLEKTVRMWFTPKIKTDKELSRVVELYEHHFNMVGVEGYGYFEFIELEYKLHSIANKFGIPIHEAYDFIRIMTIEHGIEHAVKAIQYMAGIIDKLEDDAIQIFAQFIKQFPNYRLLEKVYRLIEPMGSAITKEEFKQALENLMRILKLNQIIR